MVGGVGWVCFAVGLLVLLIGLSQGDRVVKLTGMSLALAGHGVVWAKRVIAAQVEGGQARPTVVLKGWSKLRQLPVWGQGVLAAVVIAVTLIGQAPAEPPVTDVASAGSLSEESSDEPSEDPSEGPSKESSEEPAEDATSETARQPVEKPSGRSQPDPQEPAEQAAQPMQGATWTVTNIVDGDTVDVDSPAGVTERVRLIGIDTPERGECGFSEASAALAQLIDGKNVELAGGARDDRDRYDRMLRYVDADGMDAGLELIKTGFAIARYDSRDGYGRHPRETAYVAADGDSPPPCETAVPKPAPAPGGPGSGPGGSWKNCTEARDHGAAPVHRGDPGYGSHLDRDNDGVGCE